MYESKLWKRGVYKDGIRQDRSEDTRHNVAPAAASTRPLSASSVVWVMLKSSIDGVGGFSRSMAEMVVVGLLL